ncbi:glycosyltransferase family 2 protein [Mongoliitalea daihaiensis]|uniref:glycosyltransferase family 2 protein n=1 Tax=Mongoliitalea daihaiensis TaxID=2782006 RepID=UPI001F24A226|nr:glycosyltransferase family 2 protein [Mongoliitalea daihaiensis]UJP64166.1 glycosyltransferase family 2 protein [Mongoliitalea daihaiensis]
MNDKPFFSIILPVFNRLDKIPLAIKSVLNQSFKDWELLIVDDQSWDGTFEYLRELSYDQIKIFRTAKNSGPASARNLGIDRSRGTYIVFLDSDDQYHPDFLSKMIALIKGANPDTKFYWSGYRFVFKDKVVEKFWKPPIIHSTYQTFLRNLHTGTNSGLIISKEILLDVGGFDESLLAGEDTDLLLRLSQKGTFDMCPEYLIDIYVEHDDRLSKDFSKIAKAYNKIIPKHIKTIKSSKILMKKFFYKLMWLNYHLGDKKEARKYFKLQLHQKVLTLKSVMIFIIFELFGKEFGKQIHLKLASIKE